MRSCFKSSARTDSMVSATSCPYAPTFCTGVPPTLPGMPLRHSTPAQFCTTACATKSSQWTPAPTLKSTVLAVEGFEGTDKCLARGGELAGKDGGAVAVKVAKLNHDMRFDVPCLGAQTLETCAAAKISVLAIEAGKTLLLEREMCEALAKKNKISITTIA